MFSKKTYDSPAQACLLWGGGFDFVQSFLDLVLEYVPQLKPQIGGGHGHKMITYAHAKGVDCRFFYPEQAVSYLEGIQLVWLAPGSLGTSVEEASLNFQYFATACEALGIPLIDSSEQLPAGSPLKKGSWGRLGAWGSLESLFSRYILDQVRRSVPDVSVGTVFSEHPAPWSPLEATPWHGGRSCFYVKDAENVRVSSQDLLWVGRHDRHAPQQEEGRVDLCYMALGLRGLWESAQKHKMLVLRSYKRFHNRPGLGVRLWLFVPWLSRWTWWTCKFLKGLWPHPFAIPAKEDGAGEVPYMRVHGENLCGQTASVVLWIRPEGRLPLALLPSRLMAEIAAHPWVSIPGDQREAVWEALWTAEVCAFINDYGRLELKETK